MARLRSKLVHVRVIFLTSIRNGTSRFTPFLTGHPITVLISIVNHHRDQNFSRYDYFFFLETRKSSIHRADARKSRENKIRNRKKNRLPYMYTRTRTYWWTLREECVRIYTTIITRWELSHASHGLSVRREWKGVFQFETRFLLDFPPFFPPSPSTYDWQEIVITVGSMPTGRTWISRVSFWSSSRDPASKHFFWPVIRRDMNRPRGESIAPGKRYLLCFFHCSLSLVFLFFRLADRRLIFIIL